MLYRKRPLSIALPGSVSLQANNFSYCDDYVSYVRHSEVMLMSVANGDSKKIPIAGKCNIHQVSLVHVHSRTYLVIASSLGAQIRSVDGLELKFFLPISNAAGTEGDADFMRGIAGIPDGFIAIGTSAGAVHVLGVPVRSGEEISLLDTLITKEHPISAMAATSRALVSGNDNGDVFIFDPAGGFELTSRFSGNGVPVTSLCTKEDAVIAAYASGLMRVYRISANELSIEISAHARSISALALHPELQLLASCSEDQYLHVWSCPDFTSVSKDMDLLYSGFVENRKLTGVAFMADEKIGVVAYDEDDITVFERSS